MELFLDVLGESLVDTAKMLPFLFLAYLFIEYVENRHGERIEAILAGGGRWGSVPAALLGCVPSAVSLPLRPISMRPGSSAWAR